MHLAKRSVSDAPARLPRCPAIPGPQPVAPDRPPRPWAVPADRASMQETLYLVAVPGMRASIRRGLKTTVAERSGLKPALLME